MDKFIIRGLCPNCGELIGTLKAIDPPAYSFGSNIFIHDIIRYHVAPTMTKARMKCESG